MSIFLKWIFFDKIAKSHKQYKSNCSSTLQMSPTVKIYLRFYIPFLGFILSLLIDTTDYYLINKLYIYISYSLCILILPIKSTQTHFADLLKIIIKFSHFADFEQVIIKISHFADFEQVIIKISHQQNSLGRNQIHRI